MKSIFPEKYYVTRYAPEPGIINGSFVRMPPTNSTTVEEQSFKNRKHTADNTPYKGVLLPSIVIENNFQGGFVINGLHRSGCNRNVVWKITHPCGVELNITSENMDLIMQYCTIDKSLIVDELILTNKNELTSKEMPQYTNFMKKQNEVRFVDPTKLKCNDVIGNFAYPTDNDTGEYKDAISYYVCVYIGSVYVHRSNVSSIKSFNAMDILDSSIVRHLVYDMRTQTYSFFDNNEIKKLSHMPQELIPKNIYKCDGVTTEELEKVNHNLRTRVILNTLFFPSSYYSEYQSYSLGDSNSQIVHVSISKQLPRTSNYDLTPISLSDVDVRYKTVAVKDGVRYRVIAVYNQNGQGIYVNSNGNDKTNYITLYELTPSESDHVNIFKIKGDLQFSRIYIDDAESYQYYRIDYDQE